MSQTKAQLVQPVGIVTGTGINVTGVITATSFVGSGEGLTGVASTDNIITGTAATFNNTVNVNSSLNATRLNVTGVLTATSFVGSGANLTGVANTGFINAEQLTVVGVVTAATGNIGNLNITKSAAGAGATVGSFTGVSTYYGDGSNLSGVGETMMPWYYNPDVGETYAEEVPVSTGIGITFNKKAVAGSGTATIKIVNAGVAGTTVQSWGVSSATFSTTALTFGSLVSDLDRGFTYQMDIPATFVDEPNGKSYVGTAWTFSTKESAATDPMTGHYLWAWNNNDQGVLGQNNRTDYSSPKQIPGATWGRLGRSAYYANHYSLVKTDNTLWIMGNNAAGQLGLNQPNASDKSSPVQIPGTNWVASGGGGNFTAGLKDDGTLWIWGNGDLGQLAQNSRTEYSSPVQVPGAWAIDNSGVLMVGAYHIMATKQDGTLWAWGNNGSGELGQNNNVKYSSPVQVGSATNWKFGSCDVEKSAAINTDGELWTWGKNQHGQLGHNSNKIYRSSPVQVGGSWSAAAFGDDMGMGIKTNGTLWAWGNNTEGQLANNDKVDQSSPIQVPGTTWSTTGPHSCAMSGNCAIAVKTDGTAWGWGNNVGMLGQGNTTRYSSPVQVNSGNSPIKQVDMTDYITLTFDT